MMKKQPRFGVRTVAAVAALVFAAQAAWALAPFKVRDIRVEGLQRVEPGTRPKRVGVVCQYFPFKLLSAQCGSFILGDNLVFEGRGQVSKVIPGAPPGYNRCALEHQVLQLPHWFGGSGDAHSRVSPQTETEQEVAPGIVQVLPGAPLVAPGRVKLRASEHVRLKGRESHSISSVGPLQTPSARVPGGVVPRGTDGQQTAFPLHHHVSSIGRGS
ncbi:MAG: hypothetical protein BWY79_01777 [Actinobacteria bacterium ADurb.Bin444]|nr:MAG: hypothetical protein BWY79_01777 [Actinobacteria bacterium ADurb.Bin444]